MHLVTMMNEEVVQPEPIGGRGLPETEHLHLEKGPLGADEVLEGFEDGQVESFGVDLDEAKPWDEVGVLPCEEGLHVPSLEPDLERTAVQPLAHPLVKPAVAVAFLAVLELVKSVRTHRGEVQRQDAGFCRVEARIAFQHRKHIGVGLEPEDATRGADGERDGECGVTGMGADVDREDRKSTRLNSSHVAISYAVFCLKK